MTPHHPKKALRRHPEGEHHAQGCESQRMHWLHDVDRSLNLSEPQLPHL